eukprot:gene6347-biopygen5874
MAGGFRGPPMSGAGVQRSLWSFTRRPGPSCRFGRWPELTPDGFTAKCRVVAHALQSDTLAQRPHATLATSPARRPKRPQGRMRQLMPPPPPLFPGRGAKFGSVLFNSGLV